MEQIVKPEVVASRRSRRAAATRSRIIAAAGRHFESHGYEATRIEDIAVEADVAAATVYKVFHNKRTLLEATLDVAMSGSADTGVARQVWWREQLDEPDGRRQLQLIARNARRIYERAGALLDVVRAAALSDERIARLWRVINDDRLERGHASMARLAEKARLLQGMSVGEAALTVWSLTGPELYALRVKTAGRSLDDYERWLAGLLITALLEPCETDPGSGEPEAPATQRRP